MAKYVIRDDKGLEEAYSKDEIDSMAVETGESYEYAGEGQ